MSAKKATPQKPAAPITSFFTKAPSPSQQQQHHGPSREGRGDGGGGDRRGEAQLRASRGERAVEQGFAIAPPDPPPVRPTHRAQERERRQSQGGRRGRTVRGDVDARSTRRRDRRGKPGERERRGRAFHDPGARTQGPSGRGRNTGRHTRDGACRASPAQSWHPHIDPSPHFKNHDPSPFAPYHYPGVDPPTHPRP